MHRAMGVLAVIAVLLVVAGCTESVPTVYSDDIPDPTTQFLQARDDIYAAVERGGLITLDMRIAYVRVAIHSYANGFETYDQFLMRLAVVDFPEGSQLTAQGYQLKSIIVWLRRGEISLENADKALAELAAQREQQRMPRW